MTWPAAATRNSRFHAIGSGSVFAKGSLKKLYRDGMPARDAVLACMHALYDAADDDSATGGPDMTQAHLPGGGHGHAPTASGGCQTPRLASTPGRSSTSGCVARRPHRAAPAEQRAKRLASRRRHWPAWQPTSSTDTADHIE